MKVRDEINKFSKDSEKPILFWLLDNYSMQTQWRFVAYCEFERYGKLSYEVNRIWKPTPEGKIIFNHKHELKGEQK